MGTQKTEQTQTTTLPGMGAGESGARNLLAQLAQSGMGQMGNISDLASGKLTLSPQDEEMIRRIQELTMQSARAQARTNYEDMVGQVEGQALEAGLGGSSVEAINRAILGRQLQGTLDQTALQGQITSAEQMRQQANDSAGLKLNANQLLLSQILGSAGNLAQMGLQERLAQATTTSTQKQNSGVGGALGQIGGMAVAAWNPLGMLGKSAAAGAKGGSNSADYSGLGTGSNAYDYKSIG